MTQNILYFLGALLLGLIFFGFVVLSAMRREKIWKALASAVAMLPVAAQAWNYGFVVDTFLAAGFFLALTWAILHFAIKEGGQD